MSTIFPLSASVGQIFEGYTFNGTAWDIVGIDLTQEYAVITDGTISDSAVPETVARTESPEFTGTVVLPQNTSIGDVSHTEIMSLSGVSGSIQAQINAKANIDNQTFTGTITLPSTTSIGDVSSTEISYLNGVSGSIQVQIDGKTTASYVDTAISNALSGVIDSAPSTLDTLNELAAALGDDPNFATTITNLIADKLTSVPGVINQYAGSGSAAPIGWLFCEGQEVLISTYTSLYNALTANGTTFPYGENTNGSGVSGSTHFRIPNFKGKVPVGKDSSQTEFDSVGETGGAKTHTLTSSEIPGHTHTTNIAHGHLDTLAAPAHTHNIGHGHADTLAAPAHTHTGTTNNSTVPLNSYLGTGTGNRGLIRASGSTTVQSVGSHGHTFTTGGASATALTGAVTDLPTTASGPASATALTGGVTALGTTNVTSSPGSGGDGAHNNLQPYITVSYIIKT